MPTRKERAGPRVIARSLAQAVQLKASGFALSNAPANHRGASDAGEARDAAHNSPQHEARTSARTEALAQLDVAFVTAVRCLDSRTVIRAVAKGTTQLSLDCALHEVASGDRLSAEHGRTRMQIATLLLRNGAAPNNRAHGCGGTPLHHSLAGGYTDLSKLLLSAHADANALNRFGVHPLHMAAKRGLADCLECLLECSLPSEVIKEELCWSVQTDRLESAACLLSHGAPTDVSVLCPWTRAPPSTPADYAPLL